MRRFVYLDTDALNSYLAQIYGGLTEKTETETQSAKSVTKQGSHTVSVDGQIDAKIFGKGVEGKLDYTLEKLKGTNNTDLIKDVQTKIVHDNAFEQLMLYLINEGLICKPPENKIGDFVELEDSFFILDLDYYKNLFEPKGYIEYLQQIQGNNTRNEIEKKSQEELNRDQQRNNSKNIEKIIKETVEKSRAEYKNIHDLINMIISVVPYKRMLCIGEYLLVINDVYCRDSIEMLSFKYGGKIKVLGYITNKIVGDEQQEGLSVFAGVSASINTMMKIFFDKNEDLFVVHPIAIYYE